MSGPACVRNRSLLGGGSLILLAIGLWPGSRSKERGKASTPPDPTDTTRGKAPPSATAHDLKNQRSSRGNAAQEERERKEVTDLIEKLRENANEASMTEGGNFPWELILERAPGFTAHQLQIFARMIASDRSILPFNRAVIAGATAGIWMHDSGNQDPARVRPALDLVLETSASLESTGESMPGPDGYGCLIFAWSFQGADSNSGAFVDFAADHWQDWPVAPDFRKELLEHVKDPEQRARLEALPGKRKRP